MGVCSNPFKGFPIAAYFIFGNELCERFNYYGMRAILSLYLVVELEYSEDSATGIYHAFNFLAYSVPILGAIAADSFFGKFIVILVLSFVYAAGSIVLAVGATDASIAVTFTIIGLVLVAVGTGGIKPCVVSFGADQFPDSDDKEKYLSNYFACFYFAINFGSLISMNLTPILRSDVSCGGKDSCYPLAFGLPAALMVFATVLFIAGCFFYIREKPKENVVFKFVGCVSSAIGNAMCHRDKSVKKEYFIDHANEKYDAEFRSDVRRVFSIILIFLPVPIFWALYDQQGSRWTFQASNMDGEIGNGLFYIKPDQIQSVNPLMILILVPICQMVVYPLFRKCHVLTTPLQKLSVGGMIAVLSFLVAALLEWEVEKSYGLGIDNGKSELKIINGLDCTLSIGIEVPGGSVQNKKVQPIEKLEMLELDVLEVSGTNDLNMTLHVPIGCVGELLSYQVPGLTIEEKTASLYYITKNSKNEFSVKKSESSRTVERSADVRPKIGLIYFNKGPKNLTLKIVGPKEKQFLILADPDESKIVDYVIVDPATYDVVIDDEKYLSKKVGLGGVYMIYVKDDEPPRLVELVSPHLCHMLWQLPQYFVISLAEVMFSVAGLEFAYSEAPPAMRALIQSLWLLTTSLGNIIVTIIATSKVFERQLYEYLFFAGLMFLVMLVFILLSVRYKYANQPNQRNEAAT